MWSDCGSMEPVRRSSSQKGSSAIVKVFASEGGGWRRRGEDWDGVIESCVCEMDLRRRRGEAS